MHSERLYQQTIKNREEPTEEEVSAFLQREFVRSHRGPQDERRLLERSRHGVSLDLFRY